MTSCGVKQEGMGMSRRKKKKRKRSEQSSSATEATISQEKPTEDPDPSISFHMLSVSESPKRVTRRSITEAPPLPRGKTYHVFFSFRNSQNDKDWVRGIIEKLESPPHCYSCCFADRDFIPGETVISNIEMAVKESVRVAVVLTEEYIESYWCKYETNVIREPGSKACIIPLQLNNCRIPQSLKDLSFIPVSKDNDKWWETLLRSLNGKIPYLPPSKSDHIFLFHGTSEKDVERTENLRTALETCACSFRCISSGRDFVYGSTIKDNVHMCVDKAATTVFALSRNFPKEKWLQHWQELSRKGFKLFPLMLDHFDLPKELEDIVIFDATREQNIWLPRLIDNLMK
uniref:Toll-like receptor 2-like protein n=1 Tax=Sinohyriopsis cumingii TaxID=165450 RepID=X2KPT8_SINCU|nr:toll-like receptor 2-like protein [Sinohyriopsis cumingii]